MIEIISTDRFKLEIYDFEAHKTWNFKSSLPVVLNFFAPWCGPCHRFAPVLEEIAEEFAGKIKVYKINIDENPLISTLFEVRSVPTTLFMPLGEEPIMNVGAMSSEGMRHALKDLFQIESIETQTP